MANGEVGYDNNFQPVVLEIKSCGCSEFKQAPFLINWDNFLLYVFVTTRGTSIKLIKQSFDG